MLFRNLGVLGKRFAQAFLPSKIGGLQLWLDANGLEVNTTNSYGTTDASGFCSSWLDQSPNGYDFAQIAGSSQPQLITSGFGTNSLPYLLFDGVDDYLNSTISSLGDSTFFLVYESVSAQNNITIIGGSSINDKRISKGTSGTTIHARDGGFSSQTDMTVNGLGVENIIAIKFNGTTGRYSVNGGTWTDDTLDAGSTITGLFLATRADLSGKANVKISELIVYDSIITDEQGNLAINYLNNKYGIY